VIAKSADSTTTGWNDRFLVVELTHPFMKWRKKRLRNRNLFDGGRCEADAIGDATRRVISASDFDGHQRRRARWLKILGKVSEII